MYLRLRKDFFSVETWLVFLKNSLLTSTFTASWFLGSCVFSAWFVFTLSRKCRTKTILLVSCGFYLLCILSSNYSGALPDDVKAVLSFFCFPLNIFNGCVYFSLGKLIAENESVMKQHFNRRKSFALFVLFYITYALEIGLAKRLSVFGSTDVAFSTAFVAFFLFMFLIQSEITVKNHLLLRKLSTIIYLCQGNVLLLNSFLKRVVGVNSSVVRFFVSALATAMICVIVLRIQKENRWEWAKLLT